MNPTQQQLVCVQEAQSNNLLKVEACAGSGKTSTILMMASAINRPSIYMAFNKTTATEASERFPNHVVCRTTHSFAYESIGRDMQHKLSRPKGKYVSVAGTSGEIARYFKLSAIDDVATAPALGYYVKRTVERYEQSADVSVAEKHVPTIEMKKEIDLHPSISKIVLSAAKALWAARSSLTSPVLATHDTYLKLYQLSKPKLNCEVLYLDEAQDTTPCVLDIVMSQEGKKVVLVGDARQAIYAWRGAHNAMKSVHGKSCPLSLSFRYGQAVADVATKVLQGDMDITGNPAIESVVGRNVLDTQKPFTNIYRTNSLLLIEAVCAIEQGVEVDIEIDVRDFVKLLQSATALFKGDTKNVKHDKILPYVSWADMKEDSKDDGELSRIVQAVVSGDAERMISLLESYVACENPQQIFTTAHKSKGREWDQVCLAEDFPSHYNKKGVWVGLPEAEQNLLYVAATRAKYVLEINSTIQEALNRNP